MNKYEATELGVRLLAIFNLLFGLSSLPGLLVYADSVVNSDTDWRFGVLSLPIYLSNLFISALLWFGARAIAEWVWRGRSGRSSSGSPTRRDLEMVLFSAIGLYLLASALPSALDHVVSVAQRLVWAYTEHRPLLSPYLWPDAGKSVDYLVRLVIAAWLLLGSDHIVSALERGRRHTSSSETA
jgi:hypothetical protein